MKGDFSRLTFDPAKHYTRVLMQQGRVQLDADWNEQADIFLHYLRALTADVIGPHGGPSAALGFQIGPLKQSSGHLSDLSIGNGRYYVDGLLCENLEDGARYFAQPYLNLDPNQQGLPKGRLLVYLDVWERHITHLEDDRIREVALGGPDTASRAQVVWQIRVRVSDLPTVPPRSPADGDKARTEWFKEFETTWSVLVQGWQPEVDRGRLKVRAKIGGDLTDPCVASPEARFRGVENQLYRVEIQSEELDEAGRTSALRFTWSRDNGSVVFAVRGVDGATVKLETLGRDESSGLKQGDWVEFVDDDLVFAGPGRLLRVEEVDGERRTVTLAPQSTSDPGVPATPGAHALLRRWDHQPSLPKAGAVLYTFVQPVGGASAKQEWLDLEDGIQIQFQPGIYRAGDYWVIPARTATGDVEWPRQLDGPEPVLPHGVRHHFAPLAFVESATKLTDLRNELLPLVRRFVP